MTNAASFALSTALQDVTTLGTKRRFTLIGTAGTSVVFEYGLALNSTTVGRVKDPRFPTVVQPTLPSRDLGLIIGSQGLAESSPIFDEPSSYLRYTVLAGAVTSCYLDTAAQPSTGPAGAGGPAAANPYGTGVDGALVYDGVATVLGVAPSVSAYTLTRDISATSITVAAGVTINAAGFKVFYTGTCTIAATAIVQNNGNAGAVGTAGTGGAAGAISAAGSTAQGTAGGAGGSGNAAGSNGTNNAAGVPYPSSTGVGGAGGAGNANAGGTAGTWTALAATKGGALTGAELAAGMTWGTAGINVFGGGSGGGGGGGDNADAAGGGGGGGGGVLVLVGATLINNGTIQANGGAGGPGLSAAHNAGGGGGGGGGVVIVLAGVKTGAGLVQALGGAGGTKVGTSGVAGSAGTAGTVINP